MLGFEPIVNYQAENLRRKVNKRLKFIKSNNKLGEEGNTVEIAIDILDDLFTINDIDDFNGESTDLYKRLVSVGFIEKVKSTGKKLIADDGNMISEGIVVIATKGDKELLKGYMSIIDVDEFNKKELKWVREFVIEGIENLSDTEEKAENAIEVLINFGLEV